MNYVILEKARSHKYIRRLGMPGQYQYFYQEEPGTRAKALDFAVGDYVSFTIRGLTYAGKVDEVWSVVRGEEDLDIEEKEITDEVTGEKRKIYRAFLKEPSHKMAVNFVNSRDEVIDLAKDYYKEAGIYVSGKFGARPIKEKEFEKIRIKPISEGEAEEIYRVAKERGEKKFLEREQKKKVEKRAKEEASKDIREFFNTDNWKDITNTLSKPMKDKVESILADVNYPLDLLKGLKEITEVDRIEPSAIALVPAADYSGMERRIRLIPRQFKGAFAKTILIHELGHHANHVKLRWNEIIKTFYDKAKANDSVYRRHQISKRPPEGVSIYSIGLRSYALSNLDEWKAEIWALAYVGSQEDRRRLGRFMLRDPYTAKKVLDVPEINPETLKTFYYEYKR